MKLAPILLSLVHAIPTAIHNPSMSLISSTSSKRSTSWLSAQCSQAPITNAAAAPEARWAAADTDNAWDAAVAAWKAQPAPGSVSLAFPEFVSNFFNGPEGWNCVDVGDIPCSGIVQCSDTDHPAGSVLYLMVTRF